SLVRHRDRKTADANSRCVFKEITNVDYRKLQIRKIQSRRFKRTIVHEVTARLSYRISDDTKKLRRMLNPSITIAMDQLVGRKLSGIGDIASARSTDQPGDLPHFAHPHHDNRLAPGFCE